MINRQIKTVVSTVTEFLVEVKSHQLAKEVSLKAN